MVNLTQKVPVPRGNEDQRVRNKWSYAARRCLKQARRCEQLTYRLQVLLSTDVVEDPRAAGDHGIEESAPALTAKQSKKLRTLKEGDGISDATRKSYIKLNKDAMSLIGKHVDKLTIWEVEFGRSIQMLSEAPRSPVTSSR